MKICKLYLVIVILMLSNSFIKANSEIPRGIDLGEYSFGIPANQLYFNNDYSLTLSFWMNVKEFNHDMNGTQFINIRNVSEGFPLSEWGWMWVNIGPTDPLFCAVRNNTSSPDVAQIEDNSFSFITKQWKYFSFVFENIWNDEVKLTIYVDGQPTYILTGTSKTYWDSNKTIMIGGPCLGTAPLNAYIDKVQLYNKALSQTEVSESITMPLLNDESLLGYWDFEDGCTTDADGFMIADKGTIKATMYEILMKDAESIYDRETIGSEIQPFVFGEGVDPESIIQGVEESIAETQNTKAFVSNEMLNIENAEGINSVVVYDAMGKVITSANVNGVTSTQIALPSNINGVLIVKVNTEVIKVMLN